MVNQQISAANLAINIRRYRIERGFSIERFAELTGVSSRMVYDWESGLSLPKIDRLLVIAHVLEVGLDSMFTSK